VSVLVTGAAGYIGSVVTEELIKEGFNVVGLDNLKQGHLKAVAAETTFIQADLADSDALHEVFRDYDIEAVFHLAAESLVGVSMSDPKIFYKVNVIDTMNLLDVMLKCGVDKMIFSSSAAVYGNPNSTPIRETHRTQPINPYGETKLVFEKVMLWYAFAYGIKSISLRYFNAAGASEYYGEDHSPETHLIPNIIRAAMNEMPVNVFGMDYPTKDGSCVRDYIHVIDIAKAHIMALNKLKRRGASSFERLRSTRTSKRKNEMGTDDVMVMTYNLGNGNGFTVLDVIDVTRRITGSRIPTIVQPRRLGDPPILVADSTLATKELGWQPKYPKLESIIESSWNWHREHPNGYLQ